MSKYERDVWEFECLAERLRDIADELEPSELAALYENACDIRYATDWQIKRRAMGRAS